MPERNRFFKGLASWIGFRQMRIDYEPEARADGRITWNTRRLIGLSLNGLTAFSVAPLRFATMLGVVIALIAFCYGLEIVYETLVYGEKVPGYPSLFVGIMVLGGMQLIMLGVVGEYIGKILQEIKGRPVYFVAEHDVKLAQESIRTPHSPASRPPPARDRGRMNEPKPHLALRRRLRHFARGQRSDPRSDRAPAHQCRLGHGRWRQVFLKAKRRLSPMRQQPAPRLGCM